MQSIDSDYTPSATKWHWRPSGAVGNNPLFIWPIKWLEVAQWYVRNWKPGSEYSIFVVISLLSWFYFQPSIHLLEGLTISALLFDNTNWWLAVYLRNLVLTLIVAGGFHLYFYTFSMQGDVLKYERQSLSSDSSRFTFGKQVYDNMFWTLLSGVSIWTIYEVIILSAMANGFVGVLAFSGNEIWFVALFLLIPLWLSLHFYLGHRLLHWPPLYKISHIVHHRNINTGPWSGLSMHPIEHLIYLSSMFIHLFIDSHPIHVFFHAYGLTLSSIFGHVGYDALVIKGKRVMDIAHFRHQLHHKHFECNYGASELPVDAWFGSFDDGSAQARQRLRDLTKQRGKRNRVLD